MAYSSGKDGQLFIDNSGTAAARVKSWSLSASQDTIDTTFLGDTEGGVAAEQGESTLQLGFKNYLGALQYITVKVLFTSMSVTCSQGEIFTASGSFTVNGAPTVVSV